MIVSVADVKSYLGIGSAADDALIGQCIDRATKLFSDTTSRDWECSTDTTRKFDAVRDVSESVWTRPIDRMILRDAGLDAANSFYGRLLHLNGSREESSEICSITSIVNGDGLVVPSSAYTCEPAGVGPWRAIRLKRSSGLVWTFTTDPEDAISVTGKWAYCLTPPADVVAAVLEIAVYFYRRRGAEGYALDQPQVSPSGVMIYPAGFPAMAKSTIRRRTWTDERGIAV